MSKSDSAVPQMADEVNRINTALWRICSSSAADKDRVALAEVMLADGAPVRQACENQSTALHQAARQGPVEMVELLLRHGAKEWQTDKDGKKPIDYARESAAADKNAIIELLDRPVIRDPVFKSAVKAIHSGDLAALQSILRNHPKLVHDRAIEPTCYPPSYFSNPKLLWFVANNPTLVDMIPANIVQICESIIHASASADDLNYTLELVMTSSSVRRQDLQIPLMRVLLNHGAKPGDLLCVLGHAELEPVKFLIENGMPMTAPVAAALGLTDPLRQLLDRADQNLKTTALGIAVINRQMPAARLCLEAGADVNQYLPVHAHSLPVHQAAIHDDVEILRLLVKYGAKLKIRDKLWNSTPLGWALHTGKPAAEKYLRSIGAI